MKQTKSRPVGNRCDMIGMAGLIEAYVRKHYPRKTVVAVDYGTGRPHLYDEVIEKIGVSCEFVAETLAVADQGSHDPVAGIAIAVFPNKKSARKFAEHFRTICRTYIFRNGEHHRHLDCHDPMDGVLVLDGTER